MTTAAPLVETAPGLLTTAVVRRSPLVSAALDPAQAWERARDWAARAVPEAAVEAVRVGSAYYRSDGHCTLRYEVDLTPSGRKQILLVEVPRSASDLVIRAFPDDPGLPTLRDALDPVLMREVLGRVVPGTGGERGIGRCAVDVVRYPRRGRCVLRYRLSQGAGGAGELRHPVVFGKVYSSATAQAAASALRLLRSGLPPLPDGVRVDVPRALAVVPSLRLGVAEPILGRALLPGLLKAACDVGGRPVGARPRALSQAVRTAARLAAAIHVCAPPPTRLPVRELAGERAATERELTALEPVWPEVAAYLRRGVLRALESAASGGRPDATAETVAPVLSHGDFTPGQVLLDADGGVGLVDVDTMSLADPALDLGRFLAYLHVAGIRRSRDAWPLVTDLTALFLESYVDAYPPSSGGTAPSSDAFRSLVARTTAYRALALARLGASACRQLKDDRLAAVVDVLAAGDIWMRSGAG
jgi:hypothetical protein